MQKIILFLVLILILSSCSIDGNNNKIEPTESIQKSETSTTNQSGITEKQTNITNTGIQTTEIGSGFTLSGSDVNLDLSYSGKVVKKWEYNFNDFILGNSCTDDENEWKTFNQEKKKICAKSDILNSISIEPLNNRLFWIKQSAWESQLSWLYDTKSGNLQELNQYLVALIPQIKITDNHVYVVIEEGQSIGVQHLLVYDKNFSKKLTEWPKNDNEYFVIDSIEELSPTSIKIKAKNLEKQISEDNVFKNIEYSIPTNN